MTTSQPSALTAGRKGYLEFDGAVLTIRRPMAGEKRIPVRSITAVQWKAPSFWSNGWMEFSIAGAIERQAPVGKRTRAAMQNENAVLLPRDAAKLAEYAAIRDAVTAAISA